MTIQERYVYLTNLLVRVPNGYSAHAEFNFPAKYYTPEIGQAMQEYARERYEKDLPVFDEQDADWNEHQFRCIGVQSAVGLKRLFHYLVATNVLNFQTHLPTREIQLLYVYECRQPEKEVVESATCLAKYVGKRRFSELMRSDNLADI